MKHEQDFLWGVAISAYQAEGGYNRMGEPQTNWASAELRGDVDPLGDSTRFFSHYEEDLRRCLELGLNAFRMSIEWSRVQPTWINERGAPPPFDHDALRQYCGILAACRDLGIEPIVTLHHFVHPAWLGSDPWLEAETQGLFAEFVKEVVLTINSFLVSLGQDPVRYFITINEPNMLVMSTYLGDQFPTEASRGLQSASSALAGLMEAHIRSYNLIHDLYEDQGWGPVMATFNNYTSDVYWLDKLLTDVVMLREWSIPPEKAHAFLFFQARDLNRKISQFEGQKMGRVSRFIGICVRKVATLLAKKGMRSSSVNSLLSCVYESPRAVMMDYIAYDYYDPFCAHSFRLPRLSQLWATRVHPFDGFRNSLFSKWWDWRVLPEGLRFFSKLLAEAYPGKPLLIAENGMAHRRDHDNQSQRRADGMIRSEFIRLHAGEVLEMVRSGVPLRGYMYWSLFDNYEWGTYSARFGLFSLDYQESTERCAEDHWGDRPSEAYAEIIRSAVRPLASE
jgi:beta-glucosidase